MNMRNTFFFATALLLIAACQSVLEEQAIEEPEVTDETVVDEVETKIQAPDITAEQEDDNPTKSVLEVDSGGVGTIYWTPADEINVFYGTTSTHYVSQNTVNATTAVFTTTDVIGSTESASDNIWGLYPYNSSATCTGTAVTTTLPATQYGVPGTFDDDLFITIAHNTSTALKFYNVCGGIKFSLSRDDITTITFRGNNNEDIAGDISLNFVNEVPNVNVTSGQKTITLTPKAGGTFSTGENYYIILLPVSLSNGFTITFRTSSGFVGTFSYTDKPVTIKRSIFSKKANIDTYSSSFEIPENQIVYTTSDGKIAVPKSTPVSNVYSDGIGVITYDSPITNFAGFETSTTLTSVAMPNTVTSIGTYAFNGCTNLSSVTISTALIYFYESCFYGCEKLSEITIPDSVEGIFPWSFYGCSSLTDVFIPDGAGIGENVFRDCTSLTSIRFPSDITYLPDRIFMGCTRLSSVTIPAMVTTIGVSAFEGCTGLSSVSMPNSVTSIGGSAFNGCTGLSSVSIPNNVSSIGDSAFNGCTGLTSIVIPSKVTNLGLGAVGRCTNLESITVLPVTPPTAGGLMFYKSTCPIYVPAGSVDTYKNTAVWSDYASRIQAIP